MINMEKMDKKNDIERLLQAVENPEIFDEKELDAIMNDEGTKEFYSLLCDIESVKSIQVVLLFLLQFISLSFSPNHLQIKPKVFFLYLNVELKYSLRS